MVKLSSISSDKSGTPNNHTPDVPDPILVWRTFIKYVVSFFGSDFMVVGVSVLVNRNSPLAWKVSGEPISPFYAEMDSGDVQKQWKAFSRHLLAKCSGNQGFALVDADQVVVHRGRPIVWAEAKLIKIHPLEIVDMSNGEDIVCRILYPHYIRGIEQI